MDELPNPITRSEQYLAKIAGAEPTLPTPITREERYLAKIAGEDVDIPPAPITRTEQYLAAIVEGGGGGGVEVESLSVTENGTYTAEEAKAYSPVNVNVPNSYAAGDEGKVVSNGALVAQTATSTSTNGTIDTTRNNSVTVSVPTGTARTSADLTASGATVSVPAGLYASAASKSVSSGSATTPATSITPNDISISVDPSTGVITASNTAKTQSITPTVSAGYVSSGTAGTITVAAASATSNLTTQAAQTITPTTSDQTIASGKYLTGTQTIKGDANLVAGNIKNGVSIFGVNGSYQGGGGWTLLDSWDVNVTTTSTSEITVETHNISDMPWSKEKLYVGIVLDKAGIRNGYFRGTYSFFLTPAKNTPCFAQAKVGWSTTDSGGEFGTASGSTQYGVWCSYIYNNGDVKIAARYNSSYSKTIDGTYNVSVYVIDYPPNKSPFSYTAFN